MLAREIVRDRWDPCVSVPHGRGNIPTASQTADLVGPFNLADFSHEH